MRFLTKPVHTFLLLPMRDFVSVIGRGFTSFGLTVDIFQQTGKTTVMVLVSLIGFISQTGQVVAYAIPGVLADDVFTPMLMPDGLLSETVETLFRTGTGHGMDLLIFLAGALLRVTAIMLQNVQAIRHSPFRAGYW